MYLKPLEIFLTKKHTMFAFTMKKNFKVKLGIYSYGFLLLIKTLDVKAGMRFIILID